MQFEKINGILFLLSYLHGDSKAPSRSAQIVEVLLNQSQTNPHLREVTLIWMVSILRSMGENYKFHLMSDFITRCASNVLSLGVTPKPFSFLANFNILVRNFPDAVLFVRHALHQTFLR